MNSIKRIILCPIRTSICNLRCSYCYLSHREVAYQGEQADFLYPPEFVSKALSKERLGGPCYFNICADGETLLTKNIEKYVYELAKEGHYIEIVTNLTVTSVINRILDFEKSVLKHIAFKCSFHYLELKKNNLLEIFSENARNIWKAGCSASIELTPCDEYIPYINEIKEYAIRNFGALPHLTIARDDRKRQGFLTSLERDEYTSLWSQFDSDLWRFKMETFNIRRKEYCYAGAWSLTVFLETGETKQCYCSKYNQNIFNDLSRPIKWLPVGKCLETHCYNSHALLALGCIPGFTNYKYGELRDRILENGNHWIQQDMLRFLNTKLEKSNVEFSPFKRSVLRLKCFSMSIVDRFKTICLSFIRKIR